MKKVNFEVDFVVLWVDSSDSEWIKSFNSFLPFELSNKKIDTSEKRYRDNGLLKYWFRGVEKYAPWVRKIHFVTCGQKPDWLNTNNPKLHLVNHSDYIDSKYLPLFNSNAIEISIHKIPDLAEHFVYFNDDFFLTSEVSKEYFFSPSGNIKDFATFTNISNTAFDHLLLNNESLIESFINKRDAIKKNLGKWFNIHYSIKEIIKNLFYFRKTNGTFISFNHFPQAYRKDFFSTVWKLKKSELEQTLAKRFRSYEDYTHYIFREYALLNGFFEPVSSSNSKKYFDITDDIETIQKSIRNKKYKIIVINDQDCCDYDKRIDLIRRSFDSILPEKSQFEL